MIEKIREEIYWTIRYAINFIMTIGVKYEEREPSDYEDLANF